MLYRYEATTYYATMRKKVAKKRYQQVQCHTGLIFKMAIFVIVLHSLMLWRENPHNNPGFTPAFDLLTEAIFLYYSRRQIWKNLLTNTKLISFLEASSLTSVTVTANGNTVTVMWSISSSGDYVTGYLVHYHLPNYNTTTMIITPNVHSTTLPGEAYVVEVSASTAVGEGDKTEVTLSRTTGDYL